MEGAITWLFGHVHHRVPTGRAPSFTHPLLPTSAPAPPTIPPGTLACPLPKLSDRPTARPPAAIGWGVDDWAHHSARYVVNARGQRLFVQIWRPPPAQPSPRRSWLAALVPAGLRRARRARPRLPKAIVYIVHGLNDHSNKYTRVARTWVEAGYVVVAHDFHGHGRSDGYRAHTSSMQHYVDDARHAIRATDRALPAPLTRLPKFLLAHSMGGAVAIHLARDAPPRAFAGVMLTAPAVEVYPKPLLKLFAPLLATLAPLLPVQRLRFDRRRRRTRPAVAAAAAAPAASQLDDYCSRDDPLVVRSPVRARVGYEVLKSCEKIMSEADQFRVPVFVAHSREDRVTNARGTIDFHNRIASDDKTVKLYDGRVHDLLAEKRDMVMGDMVSWASKRL